jgi:hypothetical protein
MAGSFAWLSVHHGSVRLWDVVVHENGRHTLGGTVLYFSHFLREIPTCIALALFLLVASRASRPGARPRSAARIAVFTGLIAAALGLAILAFRSVSLQEGDVEAWRNLMQFYTRDGLGEPGSHWRFHLLSTVWLGVAVDAAARQLGVGSSSADAADSSGDRRAEMLAWVVFGCITLAFGFNLDPFADPRYLGHQAREIATHGPVTVPLALGLVAIVRRIQEGPALAAPFKVSRVPVPRVAVLALIPAYLGFTGMATGALETSQSPGNPAGLVAAHFFEHTLDYVFVALLTTGAYGMLRERRLKPAPGR